MKQLREYIASAIRETAEQRELALNGELSDDSVLLESGLDSLGFAILVARLEDELGYDPFLLMDEPVYPRTLGEFISIYQRFAPEA
jgi:acyl carrier protein